MIFPHLLSRIKKGATWHSFPWKSWNKICTILENLHGGNGVTVNKDETGKNWTIDIDSSAFGDAAGAAVSTDSEATDEQRSIEQATGETNATETEPSPYLQLYGMDAEGDAPITLDVVPKEGGGGYTLRAEGAVEGQEFVVRSKAGGRIHYRSLVFGDSPLEPAKDESDEETEPPPCGNPMNENGGGGVEKNPLDEDGHGSSGSTSKSSNDPTPPGGREDNPLDSPGDGGYTPTCKTDNGKENAY